LILKTSPEVALPEEFTWYCIHTKIRGLAFFPALSA
jgi:hypothetical protein